MSTPTDDPRTMDQDGLIDAMMDAAEVLKFYSDSADDLAEACYWMADLLSTLDPSEFESAKRRALAAEAEKGAEEMPEGSDA